MAAWREKPSARREHGVNATAAAARHRGAIKAEK